MSILYDNQSLILKNRKNVWKKENKKVSLYQIIKNGMGNSWGGLSLGGIIEMY